MICHFGQPAVTQIQHCLHSHISEKAFFANSEKNTEKLLRAVLIADSSYTLVHVIEIGHLCLVSPF